MSVEQNPQERRKNQKEKTPAKYRNKKNIMYILGRKNDENDKAQKGKFL